ncbi:hypothetical protein BIV57_06070 [Mangrovactinospora gilvigrisea]|uniref:ABC transporter permease n=1 Tax=Mangrovactinospora gilvigrisea TaxID=1428644 RepID=A0A1J7CA21_9ACTN|nr:hypothetical protein BIV57_06070 [Mangrovactinospora gilvigrisea]
MLVLIGSAVLGVAAAGFWLWLAPRVPLVATSDHLVYMQDAEGEQTVGQDGVFVLVTAAFGLLCGAAVVAWKRRGGVALVLALALGGVAGAVVCWQLGMVWGPGDNIAAAAKAAGLNHPFPAPFRLQATVALLVWPIGALVSNLALTAGFGPRDEVPAVFVPTGGVTPGEWQR